MKRLLITAGLALLGLGMLGGSCSSGSSSGPSVQVTLHSVADDLNGLLVIPTDTLLIANATFSAGANPIAPETASGGAISWSGDEFPMLAAATESGAVALVGTAVFPEGTYTLIMNVADTAGKVGSASLDFAVRNRQSAAPIGTGQGIWYDFTSDRDAVPGPDFPVDLETFGLGSPAAPALSAQVQQDVIDAVLARIGEAYHDQDPNGIGPDPVDVAFFSSDPGGSDVTRICIGGEDPSGGNVIGSILIDPNNSNRESVECSSLPPTGIFPREMTTYQAQPAFQDTLAALMPSLGGTPVGEHALDPIVLDPFFDPGSATAEELARWDAVTTGIQGFADALGSIVAHETGHALGLVAPGAPGVGLHGGSSGAVYSHDVTSDGGSSPAPNYLMKHGGTFNFARLAGLEGNVLPFFRPLDFAYLRDRVMLDSRVTQLMGPPLVTGITPSTITGDVQVQITGAGFAATPSVTFVNENQSYYLIGENLVSTSLLTGYCLILQVLPGTYDVVVKNPDGQSAVLVDGVTVAP